MDCLRNNAISSASEHAETTTIALYKASADSPTSWKMTPNTVINSILLHCGIQLLLVSGQLCPKVNQHPGFDQTRTSENSSAMEILSHPRVCNSRAGAEATRDNPVWSSTRNVMHPSKSSMNFTFALHTSMASV